MAKKYTGLNLAQTQPKDTIDFTGLGKGVLKAEEFKYKEKEAKKKEAMDFLKPEATFYPYQQSANKILSDAYEMMQKQDKIDPAEYQKIALEYNERIELGKAFGKEFASVVQGYYNDPEINADAAAKMLRDKYIVDGSIDELYRNSSTVLNGSEIYTQPGGSAALNAGVILPNRLKTIGEITTKLVTTGDYKKVPGLAGRAEAEVKTTLMKAASIVDLDANGVPYIKDIKSPLAQTAMDVMLTEDKVLRLVDDALLAKGVNQPTQDQRREELAVMLAPYASVDKSDQQTSQVTSYDVPRPTSGSGSGSTVYTANWKSDITSQNPERIARAVDYIRIGRGFPLTALPKDIVTTVGKDTETSKPKETWAEWSKKKIGSLVGWNEQESEKDEVTLFDGDAKTVLLDKLDANSEVRDAEVLKGDPALGLDPNTVYVKLTVKADDALLTGNKWLRQITDIYIPQSAFDSESLPGALYKAAKNYVGTDYGVAPGTVTTKKVDAPSGGLTYALGGEIDVDTKYSDFKGTETVRDLIGGFSQGGYVSTSIYDLMKKGFADGGTLPEYSAEAEEVTVTAEAPSWLKFKRDFIKENPFDINQYVESRVNQPQTGRAAYERIDEQEFRRNVREQGKKNYENKMYDYIQKKLVETNPQSGRPRGEWLDSFSEKEQKILKQNPRFQPTYITDFKRSLQSAFEMQPEQTFYNIANSPDFTLLEKRDIIMEHIENPIVSKLVDASGIFAPLSMGSKVIQSTYRDDTTISDALQGIKNDATMVEDIITDITTFIGPGTAAKFKNLLRLDRVDDAAKVISQVADKLPKEATEFVDDFVEATGKAEMKSMKKPEVVSPELSEQAITPNRTETPAKPADPTQASAQAEPASPPKIPIWNWGDYVEVKEDAVKLKNAFKDKNDYAFDLNKNANLLKDNLPTDDFDDFMGALSDTDETSLKSIVSFLFEKVDDTINSSGIISAYDYITKSVKLLEELSKIYSPSITGKHDAYKDIFEYRGELIVLRTKLDNIIQDNYSKGLDVADMDVPLSMLTAKPPKLKKPTLLSNNMVSSAKTLINKRFNYTLEDLNKLKDKYKDDFETLFGSNYDDKDLGLYAKLRDISEGNINDVQLSQFNKWFLEKHKPKLDFTPEEEVIIDAYTWGYDKRINKRSSASSTSHRFYEDVIAPKLEEIILKNQLKEDTKVIRRVSDFKALVERDGKKMTIYYSDMQPGDIYIPNSFTSTSLTPMPSFGSIESEIQLPKGQSYLPAFGARSNVYKHESEILLPFDVRFKVLERTTTGKNPMYKLAVDNKYSLIPFALLGGLESQQNNEQ